MRVRVVGAGVVGLTCADRLLAAGHEVEVVSAAQGESTTSAVAAALWYPYLALPRERVGAWAEASYAAFGDLARHAPESGVRVLPGRELHRGDAPEPWFVTAVPGLRRLLGSRLPPGYATGWAFVAPVADMSRYLPWLAQRVAGAGGTFRTAFLDRLDGMGADVVVDCAGLGARELAGDPTVHAVRGQVVLVEQVGLAEWVLDETAGAPPTYVVPRLDVVVCGGTAQEGDERLAPDSATARALLARCAALVPALSGAAVVGHRVGLRPARPQVRVERVGDVVHCYGHGGAGVTLSWGCADEVVRLVG